MFALGNSPIDGADGVSAGALLTGGSGLYSNLGVGSL